MLKIENERIEAVKRLIKEILVRISPDCQNVDVVFDGFQEGIDRYFVNFRYLYFPSLKLEFDNFRTTDKTRSVVRLGTELTIEELFPTE